MFKINDVEVTVEQWREWSQVICDATNEFLDKIKEKQKKEIKAGDLVRVVDNGLACATSAEWIFQNIEDVRKCRYAFGCVPSNGLVGKVVAMHYAELPDETLCYIESILTGECYLIGINGLEKFKED